MAKKGNFAIMKHNELLELANKIIHDIKTLEAARFSSRSFTRKRGMDFPQALGFMLDMQKTTLQTRLNLFFENTIGGNPISQQAFSKLRMKFDHSPFEKLVRESVKKEYSGNYELPLWNGYHILGVDGSYLQLPRVDILRESFGTRGNNNCPIAGNSVLFDILHGWVIDPIITTAYLNERAEFENHIDFLLSKLPNIASKSILLGDRGYPSKDLINKLHNSNLKFLMRCSSSFTSEVNDADMGDSTVLLANGTKLRVVKFELLSGEIEILITNLFEFSTEQIIGLYTLRWSVETEYFKLKRELSVEKFSGETPNSIRQDFWASMFLLNSVAVFQHEADETVQKRQDNKSLKHAYRARTSDLIITLRNRFIFAVLCGHPSIALPEINDVIQTMSRVVSPVRPSRSFPRNFRPYLVVKHNLKSRL